MAATAHPLKAAVTGRSEAWLKDLCASFVVFLISLPLCVGIAAASGLDPAAGLISGIVGGLVVASMGGCSLQVTGPTATLAVVVFELVEHQGLAALAPALFVAGGVQILAGSLRLGRWFLALAPPVVEGMLVAIGLTIVAGQFHVMLGSRPQPGPIANLLSLPTALQECWSQSSGASHLQAALIGAVTLATIFGWKSFAPGRARRVPAPLVGLAAGATLAGVTGWDVHFVTIPLQFANTLHASPAIEWSQLLNPTVAWAGVVIALIASAESMLSAATIDKYHAGPRTNFDRELAAQGLGNIVCGFLGGLPMAGVVVRGAANCEAGAKSRRSSIVQGLWLLVVIAAVPGLLRLLPAAGFAGVLVYCGIKLVNLQAGRKLLEHGLGEILVYAATIASVLSLGLLAGVALGLALATVRLLVSLSHFQADVCHAGGAEQPVVKLTGAVTFLRLPQLVAALERFSGDHPVRIDLTGVHFIDLASRQLISEWEQRQAVRFATR